MSYHFLSMSLPLKQTGRELSKFDVDAAEVLLSLSQSNSQIVLTSSSQNYPYSSNNNTEMSRTNQSPSLRTTTFVPKTPRFYNQTNDNKENINPNIKHETKTGVCASPMTNVTPSSNISKRDSSFRKNQKHSFISRVKNMNTYIASPSSPYSTTPRKTNIEKPRYTFDELMNMMVPKEPIKSEIHSRYPIFPSVLPVLQAYNEKKELPSNWQSTPNLNMRRTPMSYSHIPRDNSMTPSTPSFYPVLPFIKSPPSVFTEPSPKLTNSNVDHNWYDLEEIVRRKNNTAKSDTKNIDLKELYNTFVATRGKPLMKVYLQLYSVLYIKLKAQEKKKLIRNNINYKIKNLLITYPHLHYYGEARDFNLTRLQTVPEVLIVLQSPELRDKFQSVIVGRAKGSKAAI